MTHVTLNRTKGGGHRLVVDGFDMSMHVLAEGFRVEVSDDPARPDLVHLVIAADTIEADLPDSVISAVKAGG